MRPFACIGMIIAVLVFGLACAKSDSPLSPSDMPKTQNTDMASHPDSHHLWYYSLVYYDPATNELDVVPVRNVSDHWNVLKWLEQGPCANCLSIKSATKLLNNNLRVAVQIKHPFPSLNLTGFDVRGIAIFKGTQTFPVSSLKTSNSLKGEAELMNADGFTTLYNPTTAGKGPDGLQGYLKGKMSKGLPDSTLNGYMRFDSPDADNTRSFFKAGASITSNFEIHLPTGPFVFGYAVDASWVAPDVKPVKDPNTDFPLNANCAEPYRITVAEVPTDNGLTDKGGKTTLNFNVYDHQGKDSYKTPLVECPDLFDGTIPATWVELVDNYDTWTVDLDNTKLAKAGRYKVLIAVEDNDNDTSQEWVNLTGYQVWTVMVTPDTSLKGWAVTFGGSYVDQVLSSVTDSSGNVYVTGFFSGDTNFDPNGSAVKSTTGYLDCFLAKYDASGKFVWVNTWGDPDSDDMGTNVALSGSHVLVYGFFESTADFDPGSGTDSRTSNGAQDMFLSVFDLDGNRKWTDTWGGSEDEYSGGLGVDAAGNIYMGGTFGSTCDFDPGAGKHEVTAVGWDQFLLKFTSSGTFLWVKTWTMGSSEDELVSNIATTPSGDTWMCGYFTGTGDFNPDPDKIDQHSSLGMDDAWVSRFDSNGNFKFAKTWGEADDDDVAMAVAPDAIGNCYVTGYFANTVDFDPGTGTHEIPSAGYYDAFLLELDPIGNYVWSGTMGGGSEDTGQGVAVDSLGNVLIVGQFQDTANVSPTTVQSSRVSNGGTDIFLSKISAAHDFLWADTWGGTDFESLGYDSFFEFGSPLWVDIYGKSYVGGRYGSTVNFNPSGGTDNHTADYYDAFITTIPPNGNW